MSLLDRFRSTDSLRQRAAKKASLGIMHDFLSTPLIDPKTPIEQTPIVSLDLETTGLDPNKDDIVSVGLVEMQKERIRLNTTWHQLIRLQRELPHQSVVIHNITDDQMQQGRPLAEVLPEILRRLKGKVMLVHYKSVEQDFLNAACLRLYGAPFVVQTIDTLQLGMRVFELQNHTIQPTDLRLFNLRPRYNLPLYRAHNAMIDALATAELFLALSREIAPRGNAALQTFLTR